MSGNTYDAKHLDQFLNSSFGDNSPKRTKRSPEDLSNSNSKLVLETVNRHKSVMSKLPVYLTDPSTIKPSISFRSIERNQVKFTQFVDLQDGPSSLLKRDKIPTLYGRHSQNSHYEDERKKHLSSVEQSIDALRAIQTILYQKADNKSALKSPLELRKQFLLAKENLKLYSNFKEAQRQLVKRDRLVKSNWKHGILGVQDADAPNPGIFY